MAEADKAESLHDASDWPATASIYPRAGGKVSPRETESGHPT